MCTFRMAVVDAKRFPLISDVPAPSVFTKTATIECEPTLQELVAQLKASCEQVTSLTPDLVAWIESNAQLLVAVEKGKIVEVHCNFNRNQVVIDVIKLASTLCDSRLQVNVTYKKVEVTLPQRHVRQRTFIGQYMVPANIPHVAKHGHEIELSPPFPMGFGNNLIQCAKGYRIDMIPRQFNGDELSQLMTYLSEFVNSII